MSTKNLARTVIEGGRSSYNKWLRYRSHAQERRRGRMVSSRLLHATEFDDDFVYAKLDKVGRSFRDKLGPAGRWLSSQVGRPWNKVRSELFARFDARTTAGRHILFCHLLSDVRTHDESFADWYEFAVDAHGTLRRERKRARWRSSRLRAPLPEDSDVLATWIAGRRVGERSPHFYWFVQTPAGSFRQHLRLTDAEAERWRALPEWFREQNEAFNLKGLRATS